MWGRVVLVQETVLLSETEGQMAGKEAGSGVWGFSSWGWVVERRWGGRGREAQGQVEGTQGGWRRARTSSTGRSCGQEEVVGDFACGCPVVAQACGSWGKDPKLVVGTEARLQWAEAFGGEEVMGAFLGPTLSSSR